MVGEQYKQIQMIKLINGPKNSITDIDGFLVGNAHDDHIKSGVTVLTRSTI